ncbi:hypothetical protein H0H81_012317 [Sphagnurus paluster]|uniref:Amino acid permease n=1 Tax=Sphagnurus paluster TaxID=117069 RepID=A0A9P7KFL4_9AGAR|nr:hypothetical protein H0H81_012317 [Sphagnurus paluster]
MLVGLAMAEVCSAHPTSGGPYFWAAMLSEPNDAPLASWITVWWHALGTFSLVVAILAKAPTHQSAKFVFQKFIDGTGPPGDGWSDRAGKGYVVVIGILIAQYTLTGFDASAHMTEETRNAAMAGSVGIVMAIGVSAILGWFLLLGLLFSIQDLEGTLNSATGQPVTQIFLDTVGENGAIVLMVRLYPF